MEEKPNHFDGSFHFGLSLEDADMGAFEMTDEMRVNIGRNPYSFEQNEQI